MKRLRSCVLVLFRAAVAFASGLSFQEQTAVQESLVRMPAMVA